MHLDPEQALSIKPSLRPSDTGGMANRWWAGVLGALLVACGGDEGGAEDHEEGDAGEPLEDAAVQGDAGDAARDAAALTDARADAATDGGIRTAGSCSMPGKVVGETQFQAGCLSSSDLASRGCVLGATQVLSGLTHKATRAQMEATRFAIIYTGGSQIDTYLCTGTPPQMGWICQGINLGDCSFSATEASCSASYVLNPVPTVYQLCSERR